MSTPLTTLQCCLSNSSHLLILSSSICKRFSHLKVYTICLGNLANTQDSDSVGLGWARDSECLPGSQARLVLPVPGARSERPVVEGTAV